ncbi:hypothetical protein RUM43_005638 [Polyplax serrata]|uniref:Uncharacterized protein n=1 Tax=Polyplax serrata TaxID=468196 RepID=A0AAN8PX95_POLSC
MRNKLKRKETWSMVKRTGDEKFPAGGPTSDKTWRIVYEDHVEQVVQEACERKAEAEEEEEEGAEGEESSERIPPMRSFRWGAQAAPIENDLSDGTGGHAHGTTEGVLPRGHRKEGSRRVIIPPDRSSKSIVDSNGPKDERDVDGKGGKQQKFCLKESRRVDVRNP